MFSGLSLNAALRGYAVLVVIFFFRGITAAWEMASSGAVAA
jgi:hypothetical protein